MKLIITSQASRSLEQSLFFYKKHLGYSLKHVVSLRKNITAHTKLLVQNPKLGQIEESLAYLNQDHRRLSSHPKILMMKNCYFSSSHRSDLNFYV